MMKNTLKALTVSLGLFVTASAIAQTNTHCGYDELHQFNIANDPGYESRLIDIETAIQQNRLNPIARKTALITIPVIVHVVHNGEAVGVGGNISEAQVLSQMEVLNKDYRFLNADASLIPSVFQSLATDMSIEFCLAIRDPDGNPINGIERINGGQSTWTMSDVESNLKPTTIWDPTQYLNIWTLQLGGANAGTLGYSSKPGQDPTTDGVVVQFKYFGTTGNIVAPFNKGRTATHEIGHFFGLDHLWGLGEPNVSACGDDDGIADTPNQSKANYSCPSFPSVSCSNGPNGDMFMNYMDYVNDACMFMFTAGQKARVDNIVNIARGDLASSSACSLYMLDAALVSVIYPSTTVCQNTFTPVILVRNSGSQTITSLLVNMVIDQSTFRQQQWTGSITSGESVYIPINAVTLADGIHEMNIYISNPNNGTDQLADNDSKDFNITVANQTGIFALSLPVVEGFESPNYPPTLWEVTSVGGASGAWVLSTEGGFAASPNGVKVDFFTGNTSNQKQALVTPYFEVPAGEIAALSFTYAYARRDSASNDSLNIYYSLDCGDNWIPLWSRNGFRLQTAAISNNPFIPTATEWERIGGVRLPQLQGQGLVRFKFEAVSNNGNNIYLDDINIENWTVGITEQQSIPKIAIYPNPAAHQITIDANGIIGDAVITIYDLQGKLLLNKHSDASKSITIDVSSLASGLYMVKVSSASSDAYQKLIVE
jgi:hypothetical protein